MTVALSIMVGALLVRLNRGMPTLDWKTLEPERKKRLTAGVVQIAREYVVIVALNGALLIALVALTTLGKDAIFGNGRGTLGWPDFARHSVSALIGGIAALSVSRMAYVVWRDYDIVRLQKALIDMAAVRDEQDRQDKAAKEKLANIRAAGLMPVGTVEPKSWDG
jgi:hypothetical protein